jgi:predicted metal-binding membrane protein
MHEMPMPGGWATRMMWTRMPGQTWAAAEASFLGMWIVMTVTMMLPSLAPTLRRLRQSVAGTGTARPALLTALVGAGYFFVWTLLGAALFPLGVVLAAIQMRQPALARVAPIAVGIVVLTAGLLQRTAWKARHLACCREERWPGVTSSDVASTAWRRGVQLGVHCCHSCAGPMAILLALGVMELRVMVVVAVAVTVERLAPAGERVARLTGTVAIAAGMLLIVRGVTLGR